MNFYLMPKPEDRPDFSSFGQETLISSELIAIIEPIIEKLRYIDTFSGLITERTYSRGMIRAVAKAQHERWENVFTEADPTMRLMIIYHDEERFKEAYRKVVSARGDVQKENEDAQQ